MWMVLAIVAGAALAAYGSFVWRHETQRRKEGRPDKKDQTRLLGCLNELPRLGISPVGQCGGRLFPERHPQAAGVMSRSD